MPDAESEYWVCIRFAGDYNGARQQMVKAFGAKWAFQYASSAGPVGVIMKCGREF